MKAQYHKTNGDWRYIQRGTRYYVQTRIAPQGTREHDCWEDRGGPHDSPQEAQVALYNARPVTGVAA